MREGKNTNNFVTFLKIIAMANKNCVFGIIGFIIVYIVSVMAGAFIGFLGPVFWVFFTALSALLASFSYFYLASRWQKFGLGIVLSILVSVILLAAKEINLQGGLIIILAGVLSDIVRYITGNTCLKAVYVSYPILSLGLISWNMRLWTNTQWYVSNAIEEMGQSYADGLESLANSKILILVIVAVLFFAYSGIRLSHCLMKKSEERFI